MKDKSIINLSKYDPSGDLGVLFEKAKEYNALTVLINGLLSENHQPVQVCSFKNGTLTIGAKNQSTAFLLNQKSRDILDGIHQQKGKRKFDIRNIKVIVSVKKSSF